MRRFFLVKLERFKADRNGIADAHHMDPSTGGAQEGQMTWWNVPDVRLSDIIGG